MRRHDGFTLIEVMITVAIIAILAAIALPSYGNYIMRGKLVEARSTLADQRVKLEQFFQDNRTYAGACTAGTIAPNPTGKYFTYTCTTLNATQFVVEAVGISSQGMGGFTFRIDQANQRTTVSVPTGWSGANTNCWVMKKDGSC